MKTENSTRKGKAIEYYIISELLKNDFEVFIPVVDEGVDLIIKDRKRGYVDIQIKSRTIKNDDDYFSIKDFEPKENFFIICHNINTNEFFVMPSITFHKKSEIYKEKEIIKRKIPYLTLKEYSYHKDEKGLELLRKALENSHNRLPISDPFKK